MQVAYRFKLRPTEKQIELLENWQHKVGYLQNVNADVLQQSLRHVDTAFNKFFKNTAGFPNFKQHKNVGFEFKPGTTKLNGNDVTFPTLGTMRFFKSREIPASWEIRTATISRDIDGWYVSVLLRDETVPEIVIKKPEDCETIQGIDLGISDASWYSLRLKTEQQAAKLGNLVILVDPKFTSLKCPVCHFIDKSNRNKEKFLCGQCGHVDDADTNGSVNIAHRGLSKLGTVSLLVVSQKVTPKKTVETQRASSEPRDESRNPAVKSTLKTVKASQLKLFTVKSVFVESKPRAKKKQKPQDKASFQGKFPPKNAAQYTHN